MIVARLNTRFPLKVLQFFIFFLSIIVPISGYATECFRTPYHDVRIGYNIEQKWKVKVGAVCTSGYSGGSIMWLGVEFLDYPKNVFKFVTNSYEVAFSLAKKGMYVITLRRKARDMNNHEGYINYIWNIEAVENSW
jgi:hypothetical protein